MEIIFYTQRVEVIESYNERRDCADQKIPEFIKACGFLSMPLPNNKRLVEEILSVIRPIGIILTGGNSLVKYGGNAPERDETDSLLLEYAVQNRVPVYGFCRGMQSILDYFGNDLENVKGHVAVRHNIVGTEVSREVNSYHNQACLELKNNSLEVIMKAEDGVIEKVRHKDLPIVGTMWHPERESDFKNEDINLIKELMGGK